MIYNNGERMSNFLGLFVFIVVQFSLFWGAFNKTIIPLALIGYEIIASYHLVSNARSWNNC